ncbi:Cell wall integrity and stress response component 2 [Marasmius sp. AFHP31]|nr:Cell wall integrity and stress response component 2 [Marasmius sp. AFHP31]
MRFLSAPLIIVSASYAFTSAAAAATVQPRTGPETVAHCGPWNHKGCFVDTPQRTLPTQLDVWGNNTVEFCIDQCDRKGFTYAAVEYGDQCFCGNTFDPSTPHSTGCNMTCAANPNEICGGTYASNVYEKALPVTTCGLWRDVPRCGDCKATDFKYGSYDQCYMGCTGNGRQLCGGGEGEGWEMIYTMGGGPSGGGSGGSGGSGGGTSGGGSGGSGGGSGGGSSGGSSGGSGGSGGGGSGGSGGGGSSGGGTGDGPWTPCGCYQWVY